MMRVRVALAATGLFGLLVVPVALAGGSDGPDVKAKAVSSKKFKKLKKQVKSLQLQLDDVAKQQGPPGETGQQGPPGPATGPAGGDLDGSYPNPSLASSAVTTAKLAPGAVDSSRVADGSLTGVDVLDDDLTGADVANNSSLGSAEIDERDLSQVGGYLPAHINDLGGPGTTRFGSLSGVSTAAASSTDVEGAVGDTLRVGRLAVSLTEDLAAGQSRTFTVMLNSSSPTPLSCTATAGIGTDGCFDSEVVDIAGSFSPSIRVENTGSGISSTADARIGLSTWIAASQD